METLSTTLWRSFIRGYVRGFPIGRGKRRVMEALATRYAASEEQLGTLPGGAKIRLDLREHVQRWIYFFGVYEEATVRWFLETLRPGMTVLDIGSHVGQYSLIAASAVGPGGRVHAFEPNPATHERLKANVDLNAFHQVRTHQIALSDQAGQAHLYVPRNDNVGEASLQQFESGMEYATVRCSTLDEWARTADLGERGRIDLIKMDVQGYEEKVLTGAAEVLERHRPIIVCEVEERWLQGAGSSSTSLKSLLRQRGYRPYRLAGGATVPVDEGEVHAFENLVLLPTDRIN